jgi:hypothetical protein
MEQVDGGNEDIARVQEFIRNQVKEQMAEMQAAEQAQRQQRELGETDESRSRRQLKEVIDPVIGPDLQDARFVAADAKDEVRFYRKNPEALEHEEEIEKVFMQLKQAGRATDRATIYQYVMGREFTADREKFTDKQLERRKKQLESADIAQDMGAGAIGRAQRDPKYRDFDKLSLEDMEKALDGVTF